jgi:putative flavoprotein involved in K+ transport
VFWWLDAAGVLDERYDEIDDITRARHVPSPQLIGTPSRAQVDLGPLQAMGVRVVGRLAGIRDGVAQLSGSLANLCKLADLKMNRLLDRFDEWALDQGVDSQLEPPHRPPPTPVDPAPVIELDLRSGAISTVIWACGYRADYSWLELPVLDRHGRIRHDGGVVTDAPGVYVLGTTFLRRRRSTFICGAEHDTLDLAEHLHGHLDARTAVHAG